LQGPSVDAAAITRGDLRSVEGGELVRIDSDDTLANEAYGRANSITSADIREATMAVVSTGKLVADELRLVRQEIVSLNRNVAQP